MKQPERAETARRKQSTALGLLAFFFKQPEAWGASLNPTEPQTPLLEFSLLPWGSSEPTERMSPLGKFKAILPARPRCCRSGEGRRGSTSALGWEALSLHPHYGVI